MHPHKKRDKNARKNRIYYIYTYIYIYIYTPEASYLNGITIVWRGMTYFKPVSASLRIRSEPRRVMRSFRSLCGIAEADGRFGPWCWLPIYNASALFRMRERKRVYHLPPMRMKLRIRHYRTKMPEWFIAEIRQHREPQWVTEEFSESHLRILLRREVSCKLIT